MHIPDGYLSPQTYGPLYGLMIIIWHRASIKVKQTINKKNLPLLASASAFSFIIQMFNIPIPGGSTGHAVGSAVIAITLGPWAAVISISTVLILQALLFSDGGITAIAANSFTTAFIMPFSAYYVFKLIAGKYKVFGLKQTIGAAIAGYVSINISALTTAILIGIQPLIAKSATGRPLFSPFSLKVAIPAISAPYLLFFGLVEAFITGFVCAYLAKSGITQTIKFTSPAKRWNLVNFKKLYLWLSALVVLTPLGLLAAGSVWGEWTSNEVGKQVGFIPKGMKSLESLWNGVLSGYNLPGFSTLPLQSIGYVLSAIIAIAIFFIIFKLMGFLLPDEKKDNAATNVMNKHDEEPSSAIIESRHDKTEQNLPEWLKQSETPIFPNKITAAKRAGYLKKTINSTKDFMTEAFLQEKQAGKDGLLQAIDARVKLIAALVLVVTLSFIHYIIPILVIYFLLLLSAGFSKINVRNLVARSIITVGFFSGLIMLPASLNIVIPGKTVLKLTNALALTDNGLRFLFTFVSRSLAMTTVGVLLILTTKREKLINSLKVLRIPTVFVMLISMAYRFLAVLIMVLENLHLAKKSRTINLNDSKSDRRWIASRIGWTFTKTINMSDEVAQAMISRGWQGD